MADNIAITPGSGATVSTEEITTLNGGSVSAQHGQRVIPSIRTADGTAVDVTDAAPMPVQTQGSGGVKTATLSLSVSPAYSQGDVLAETQEIANFFPSAGESIVIQNLVVIDQDDNGAALTIIFLDSNVSLGTENSAPSISDANAAKILGFVPVLAADYKDLGGVKVASINGIGIVGKTATASIWVAALFEDATTKTYSASGIVLNIGTV